MEIGEDKDGPLYSKSFLCEWIKNCDFTIKKWYFSFVLIWQIKFVTQHKIFAHFGKNCLLKKQESSDKHEKNGRILQEAIVLPQKYSEDTRERK